jgi:hypothetical protein
MFNKILKIIVIVFFGIILLLVGSFYPLGVYHAYKKHSTSAFVVSFFVPIGFYRGVERLWHKDEAVQAIDLPTSQNSEIFWEDKLSKDMSDIILLYENIGQDIINQNKTNERIEILKKRFEKYPNDKSEKLRNGVKNLVKLLKFYDQDIMKFFNTAIEKKSFNIEFSNNDSTIFYKNILYKEFKIDKKMPTKFDMSSTMKSKVENVNFDKINKIDLNLSYKKMEIFLEQERLRVYNMLFTAIKN